MMRISTALLVLSLVAGLPVRAATAYIITLNGGGTSSLVTRADDASGGTIAEIVISAALPFSFTSTSVDGGVLRRNP